MLTIIDSFFFICSRYILFFEVICNSVHRSNHHSQLQIFVIYTFVALFVQLVGSLAGTRQDKAFCRRSGSIRQYAHIQKNTHDVLLFSITHCSSLDILIYGLAVVCLMCFTSLACMPWSYIPKSAIQLMMVRYSNFTGCLLFILGVCACTRVRVLYAYMWCVCRVCFGKCSGNRSRRSSWPHPPQGLGSCHRLRCPCSPFILLIYSLASSKH